MKISFYCQILTTRIQIVLLLCTATYLIARVTEDNEVNEVAAVVPFMLGTAIAESKLRCTVPLIEGLC